MYPSHCPQTTKPVSAYTGALCDDGTRLRKARRSWYASHSDKVITGSCVPTAHACGSRPPSRARPPEWSSPAPKPVSRTVATAVVSRKIGPLR